MVLRVSAFCVLACVLFTPSPASAQAAVERIEHQLRNDLQQPVTRLHFREANQTTWGPSLLAARGPLAPGASIALSVPRGDGDLLLETSTGLVSTARFLFWDPMQVQVSAAPVYSSRPASSRVARWIVQAETPDTMAMVLPGNLEAPPLSTLFRALTQANIETSRQYSRDHENEVGAGTEDTSGIASCPLLFVHARQDAITRVVGPGASLTMQTFGQGGYSCEALTELQSMRAVLADTSERSVRGYRNRRYRCSMPAVAIPSWINTAFSVAEELVSAIQGPRCPALGPPRAAH